MSTEWTKTPEEQLAIVSTSRVVETAPRLRQLTGIDLSPDHPIPASGELADPGAPWVTEDGRVQIFGTGGYYLEYADWKHFLSGDGGARVALTLLSPDGTPIEGPNSAWDISPHRWRNEDGTYATWLYAGVMTPQRKQKAARWPDDNWSRRVYAFREDGEGRWVRQRLPLFGPLPTMGWLGHSYGHHFIEDESGSVWVFYERVVVEQRNAVGHLVPYQTEIFARRMIAPYRADNREIKVLDPGSPPYPSTYRKEPGTKVHNGFLVEGPRPVKASIQGEVFYLIGFSSGDFPTDGYGINVAWSRHLLGPYVPMLDSSAQGLDLFDLGSEIRNRHRLSWGPARPCFFMDPQRRWWTLFHAVSKDVKPKVDYSTWPLEPLERFHRNIYLAPLSLTLSETGTPEVRVLDGDPIR